MAGHPVKTELHCTLVSGQSRSGKTFLSLKNLSTVACAPLRFIFDPLGIMAETCRMPCAETEEELMMSLESGFVFFDPSHLFPGRQKDGFIWFAGWSYRIAQRAAGRKLLLVDECWKYCTPNAIPGPLAEWVQDGAKWGCETMFVTQAPNKLHSSITGQLTEVIAFRTVDRLALDVLAGLGFDPAELSKLPPGKFIGLNLFSGRVWRGRMF